MWPLLTAQYDCYVSALVREAIERGDPEAADGRRANLTGLIVLAITEDARHLARALIENRLVPSRFAEDALHIALAAVHGMHYVLTWNFKHLNNVQTKGKIADFIEECGYEPPLVCSPDELFRELS